MSDRNSNKKFTGLYKARKETNNLSDRRATKGTERKSRRDDEVNKRRLLSDDMSPIKEDDSISGSNNTDAVKPPPGKGKQADIAERLKLWREQKSKQKEQEKKNAPKGFTLSTKKLEHKEDAFLFQRKKKTTERPVAAKTSSGLVRNGAAKESVQTAQSTGLVRNGAAKESVKKAESTSSKPGAVPTRSAQRPVKANTGYVRNAATKSSLKATQDATSSRLARAQSRPTLHQMKAERSTKSLRSKQQGAVGTSVAKYPKKTTKKAVDTGVESEAPAKSKQVVLVAKVDKDIDPGSQSDPHLSDSAVASPKHSTPKKRKIKNTVANITNIASSPEAQLSPSRSAVPLLPLGSSDESAPESPNENINRRSTRKSVVASVAGDEPTAVSRRAGSPLAYHIEKSKSSQEDGLRAALQELCVEKVDGEVSFYEVPLDESMRSTPSSTKDQSVSSSSPQKASGSIAGCAADMRPLDFEAATSPVCGKNTTGTPRSLRARGRSILPSSQPFSPHTSGTNGGFASDMKPSNCELMATPLCEANAIGTPRSLRLRDRSIASGSSTQPFSPHKSGEFSKSGTSGNSTPDLGPSNCVAMATPVYDTDATSTPRSLRPRTRSIALSSSAQPFSPQKLEDSSNAGVSGESTPGLKPSNCELMATPDQEADGKSTPRSLRARARGRSLAPSSAFKEPGEAPLSIRKSARRKTQHCKPSKSPEQMIELLKSSPMVEMNRRRSRHVSTPAATQSTFHALMDEAEFTSPRFTQDFNISSPALLVSDIGDMENVNDGETSQVVTDLQAEKVKPFRDLVTSETTRLNGLCEKWTDIIDAFNADLDDDTLGQIRSVVGKAQLLIDQRFKQFSGLVDNCQYNTGEKETTPTDLQGFWEMIYFQVVDVNNMFVELSTLQENGWKRKEPTPVKKVVKKRAVAKVAKPKVKSNFAAFRALMMKQKAQVPEAKSEAVSEDSEVAMKTFDGGFFAVSSPVQSPSVSSSTPDKRSDKENEMHTPNSNNKVLPMSMKRLRYTPAVSSPLLNDITDVDRENI